jgi:FMN phosphatase YigB (HAD superfamily)
MQGRRTINNRVEQNRFTARPFRLILTMNIEAITLDWYGTLATHRHKRGRGALFQEYLVSQRLQAAAWDRRILYDVFKYYGEAYRVGFSNDESHAFWCEFTRILFSRAQVSGDSAAQAGNHATAIRDIFGSGGFELFSDVQPVLTSLKERQIQLAIVSNWPHGLHSFCQEMGMLQFFDVVIASADLLIEKPDPRIFHEAIRMLGVDPQHTLHVGDLL